MKCKKGELIKAILFGIGAAGFVVTAATFPGLLHLMKPTKRRFVQKKTLNRTLERMMKKGLVSFEVLRGQRRLLLTELGQAELYACQLTEQRMQRSWDEKWRFLIFDIPERKKAVRDRIRNALKQLGFKRIQDSVWATPQSCKEILFLLRVKYRVRKDAIYVESSDIEDDAPLRQLFHLASPVSRRYRFFAVAKNRYRAVSKKFRSKSKTHSND